jgi:predicted dehydrogenase
MTETIGIGMLGYGFMGRAHAHAYKTLAYMIWPPPLQPELVTIAGRDQTATAEFAQRFGFKDHVSDWRTLLADERVALFDNCGPNNLHSEPTVAAARAGKHVICEKPLGRSADEAYETWQSVAATGVGHMCAFNYRFVPAVRLARQILSAGELGDIHHFRASYLQDWGAARSGVWRFDAGAAGSGALGDLGAHIIDLARYLVGEISDVSANATTFWPEREVDDAFAAAVRFDDGAVGTLEASRFATGRKNSLRFEINGSQGSLAFDLERLNELEVNYSGSRPGELEQGFRRVLVTEAEHPFMASWWPPGHIIGWEHTFAHELHHLLQAIQSRESVRPHGADLEDGYRAAEVCDAILRSAREGERVTIEYR